MEIRKLQKTGGSSLTITLPKKWIQKNSLEDKSLLKITSPTPNTLILQPTPLSKKPHKLTLKIQEMPAQRVLREIIALYLTGADEITVQSKRLSPEDRTNIRAVSNFLIGFEIIDESAEKIVLRNIFDPSKFPIPKNIEKMFLTTISMFDDALKALIENDKVLAKDIIERDFEIDKLHLIIMRQRHSFTQNNISQEEIGLSLSDLHYYEDVSTQLERIADHAVKIAKVVETMNKKTLQLSSSFSEIVENITLYLKKSNNMVKTLDKNLAHEILDLTPNLKNPLHSKKISDKEELFVLNLIEDSLDRVRGYTRNIAEVTIDQAVNSGKTMES